MVRHSWEKVHVPNIKNCFQAFRDHEAKGRAEKLEGALDGIDAALNKARQQTLEEIAEQGRKPGEFS